MSNFAQDVNFLSYFSLVLRILEKILCGQKRYVMENDNKAKNILLELFRASEAIVDLYHEIGSESGVHRLFDFPCRDKPLDRVIDPLNVIDIKKWKARRDFKD